MIGLRSCLYSSIDCNTTPPAIFDKPTPLLEKSAMDAQLDSLKLDGDKLIPIIVQDAENGQVLMMAWTNREALEKTLATGKVHTYRRSRGRIALKGGKQRALSVGAGDAHGLRSGCGADESEADHGGVPRGVSVVLFSGVSGGEGSVEDRG